jgi:hypothetical protein
MQYKININNLYNSADLLFSIPVHEKQDIINNQIENILNFNPNSNIILHVNKSFKLFNPNLTEYNNVYINSVNLNYEYAKGLLLIHIKNFLEALRLKINFKYFIILSSNEMFIKNGLINYIEKYKNGLQIVEFDKNIDWHNFHKNIEKDEIIVRMLSDLKMTNFYGGQTEGQFYEKEIFQEISNIYLKYFGNNEINNFETEEIVVQTIFKSFNISYGKPFTLQNYSNKINYDIKFIENIISNNIIIPNNNIKSTLYSPHINEDCTSIFSLKRIDRSFNDLRNYISRKGFILNKDIFQLNTYYYSNNSNIILWNNNYIQFNKKKDIKKDFNWFGFEMEKGTYLLNFDVRILSPFTNNQNIGLKIHKPNVILYNFFLEELEGLGINIWKNITIPLNIKEKQNIIFIFDEYTHDLSIEFKNFNFNFKYDNKNNKENIVLLLYENINENANNDYRINCTNIKESIIKPLSDIYNIYIFSSIYNINKLNTLINCYNPSSVLFLENKNINEQFILNIDNINYFMNKMNMTYNFILTFGLDTLFKIKITEFNFFVNKFNFISYCIPYYDNKISNSYNFLSIPYEYTKNFYNLLKGNINNSDICFLIYYYLNKDIEKNNFNFILDDNYLINIKTPLIKYLSDISNININNNNGYLFDNTYLNNIYYYNNYSKILKNSDNEFYFYKKKMLKSESFQWIGVYLNDIQNLNIIEYIKITFNIKIIKNINNINNNIGLKIHSPYKYLNEWINKCVLNTYTYIEIVTNINKKNQYIILNFDNYLDEIEFYIKDFKIII